MAMSAPKKGYFHVHVHGFIVAGCGIVEEKKNASLHLQMLSSQFFWAINKFLIYCIRFMLYIAFQSLCLEQHFNIRRNLKKTEEKKRHQFGKQLYLLLYRRRYMIKVLKGFYMDAVFSLPYLDTGGISFQSEP